MSLRDSGWWYYRRATLGDLIEEFKDHLKLVKFLTDEKDKNCQKCSYWECVGFYDSGAMGYCKHSKISGQHHPSNGCGMVEQTLVYVDGQQNQNIMTRWNFGCNLWERKK